MGRAVILNKIVTFVIDIVSMKSEKQNRVTYFIYCINAFANRYSLSPKQAFAYLQRFDGLKFLDECYEAEHQLSITDAVEDLSVICKRNGGQLQ